MTSNTINTCGTCRHWNAGLCCRFPPALSPPRTPPHSWSHAWAFVFPETTEGMTCGEWSSRARDELIERRAE